MRKAIGIDIGGTKIAAGIISEDGNVQHEVRVESDTSTKETMFDSLCQAIDKLLAESNLAGEALSFGIGVPGLVDRDNGVAVFQNNLPWDNFPLRAKLMEKYPQTEKVILDNDVYQAAFAEWGTSGLGKEDSLVFFTVSTGISTAILKGGEFLRGKGFAGELGLLPVRNGANLPFERLEKAASGPALAEKGRIVYNDGTITTEEVFQRFYQGDKEAKQLMQEWVGSITHGIYAIICILDPQKIVLGGSVMQKNPQILNQIRAALSKELIPAQKTSLDILEITKFDNNAGLIGAGLSAIL